MRIVNMDVERPELSQRNHLGPLDAGLNVILGPQGSGKTSLLHWLRSIAETNGETLRLPSSIHTSVAHGALNGLAAPMVGTVELQNRDYQYRVVTDRNGRIRFDHVRSADASLGIPSATRWDGRVDDSIRGSNLSAVQREAFVGLAAANGIYDTEAALEQLAQRLGISFTAEIPTTDRDVLRARERELQSKLDRLQDQRMSRDVLLTRQQQLELELREATTAAGTLRYEGQNVETRRLSERNVALERDLERTLQELEVLDRDIANRESELKLMEVDPAAATVGESYRKQLQDLDDRLNRWRQTLRDLRAHRETIEYNATDVRLDKQIGDQLSTSKEADPRAAMRSLEAQIMSTRQQLDLLVDQYTTVPGYDYRSASAAVAGTGFRPNEVPQSHGVYRDASGRTYVGHPTYLPEATSLPETLRSMQKDLHEVCQQLARHEAKTATETLLQQAAQLKRCEAELLQSVEKLIDERGALLQRIANEHHISVEQLTLAFGEWCQCHDHPHLQEWLLSEESQCPTRSPGVDTATRQRLIEEIESLKKSRTAVAVRADECRRQMRDADVHRRGVVTRKGMPVSRSEVEIQSDLQQVARDLAAISDFDRTLAELNEVQRQLASTGMPATAKSAFQERVDAHIAMMMRGSQTPTYYRPSHVGESPNGSTRRYDLVDGLVSSPVVNQRDSLSKQAVPMQVVRLAMRMAIAESLTARGEGIPLVLDQTLDGLPASLQDSIVTHLVSYSGAHQQIIMLSEEAEVGRIVRNHGGRCMQLNQVANYARPVEDPNRLLSAAANDHEADKWHHPVVAPLESRDVGRKYFLSESSLVEDLPAIDPDLSARCRSLGVDRIGDLLDVDPAWLADHLETAGVTTTTVQTWQAMANLLCNVPNLRPFDARIMVGAGVSHARQLSSMQPGQLLDRVERFLNTERGRKILRGGTSYELSRITSWIASAKGGDTRFERYETSGYGNDGSGRGYRSRRGNGYSNGYRSSGVNSSSRSNGYRRRSGYSSSYESDYEREPRDVYDRDGYDRARSYDRDYEQAYDADYDRSERDSGRTRGRRARYANRTSRRSSTRSSSGYSSRSSHSSGRSTRSEASSPRSSSNGVDRQDSASNNETTWKFYLELSSPVVDAPSIGPRMASKLEEHGINTVADLLNADAAQLATDLEHRRVDEETVVAWQDQARLVCRIPNLRGHDAQLLVACEKKSPESVALMEASELLTEVAKIAGSKEGQRILRGSKEPDLDEVTDWIQWASSSRSLAAAE
jgi:energy-coupling factor transporter ATP-binding protein EcfA2